MIREQVEWIIREALAEQGWSLEKKVTSMAITPISLPFRHEKLNHAPDAPSH